LISISHLHTYLKHHYMMFYKIIISIQHFTLIAAREVELFNVSMILLEYTKKKRSLLYVW